MDSALSPRQLAEQLSLDKLKEIIYAIPACNSDNFSISGCPYPADNPVIYIKSGANDERGTAGEARTQKWAFETLQKVSPDRRNGVFIPEVYRYIDLETWTIIIMEYVPGKTFLELIRDLTVSEAQLDNYLNKIGHALKLFLSFPVPQDASPGPYGGGIIRHPLFRNYQASIEYPNVELLEKHMNKIATWFDKTAPKLKFERDLQFVLSDLYDGNFIFTDKGDLYVIDFEQAGFLPLSFMTYAMIQRHYVCRLKDSLNLPEENLQIMRHVCSLLMKATEDIGLPIESQHPAESPTQK